MKPAIDSIRNMGNGLARWIGLRPEDPTLCVEVGKYVQSIEWKLRFLDHHSILLRNARWDCLGRLGSIACKPDEMVDLTVNEGLLLRLGTSESATMVILASFDGAVAACVNSCDTLGRLINRVYALGIEVRKANLPEVADRLDEACPLGLMMRGDPGVEWMRPVRALRGECQHGDLTEVLLHGYGSTVLEPMVPRQWSLDGTENVRVSDYVLMVKDRTLKLLTGCARTIAADPAGQQPPGRLPRGREPGRFIGDCP